MDFNDVNSINHSPPLYQEPLLRREERDPLEERIFLKALNRILREKRSPQGPLSKEREKKFCKREEDPSVEEVASQKLNQLKQKLSLDDGALRDLLFSADEDQSLDLLRQGADPKSENSYGQPLIHCAINKQLSSA